MIYITCFASSLLFAWLAEKNDRRGIKIGVVLCSVISILIPSVLAGLRSVSIGTDVQVYVIQYYNLAENSTSLLEYITTYTGRETLFLVLIYLIQKIFGNIQWVLFFMSLITIGCVYVGAFRQRKKISFTFFLALFYLLFYNDSYNLVRQYMAIAIIFAGIHNVEEKKYLRFLPYVIAGTLFQFPVVISVVFIPLHFFLTSKNGSKFLRQALIVGISVVALLGIEQLFNILVSLGLVSSRYEAYFTNESVSGNNFLTLIYLMEIVFVFLFNNELNKRTNQYEFYKCLAFISIFTLQLSRVMYYGNRISLIFSLENLIVLSMLPTACKLKSDKCICCLIIGAIAIVYWVYVYVIGGSSGTYPYIFFFS